MTRPSVGPPPQSCVRIPLKKRDHLRYSPADPLDSAQPPPAARPVRSRHPCVVRLEHPVDLQPVTVRDRHSRLQRLSNGLKRLRPVGNLRILIQTPRPQRLRIHIPVVQPVHPPNAHALQRAQQLVEQTRIIRTRNHIVRKVHRCRQDERMLAHCEPSESFADCSRHKTYPNV